MDERERGPGPLAFQLGGAERVGAHDPDCCGPQGAGGGAVVPVGDGQVGERRAVIPGQGDRFVEQGQAPDGAAVVEDSGGFPFDVGLGEDGFDDLAHLAVVDHGVGVPVDRQDGAGVGPADGLPPVDGLVVLGAVRVDPGHRVDVGGHRVPVQPGEACGPRPRSRGNRPGWCLPGARASGGPRTLIRRWRACQHFLSCMTESDLVR